jgi:hypothetical protein
VEPLLLDVEPLLLDVEPLLDEALPVPLLPPLVGGGSEALVSSFVPSSEAPGVPGMSVAESAQAEMAEATTTEPRRPERAKIARVLPRAVAFIAADLTGRPLT